MQYSLIKLNSARNCLRYIIRAYNIKTIHIPYYLCSVVRDAAFKENCKIKFYHIDENFKPIDSFSFDDYIVYPNYFGICSTIVEDLSSKYKNLIIDNSHAFFAEPNGIACFNSLRKFFPFIRDGAFMYAKKRLDFEFSKDDFVYEAKLLNYEELCKNENRIDRETIKMISETSNSIFIKTAIEKIKKERKNNFTLLSKRLNETNCLNINLDEKDVPFCYPYLTKYEEDADKIVKELTKKGYLIYKYWNKLPKNYSESIFYNRLVAIPLLK